MSVNGFLFFPTLCWRNRGEPVSNNPMMYKMIRRGESINNPKKENIISKNRRII